MLRSTSSFVDKLLSLSSLPSTFLNRFSALDPSFSAIKVAWLSFRSPKNFTFLGAVPTKVRNVIVINKSEFSDNLAIQLAQHFLSENAKKLEVQNSLLRFSSTSNAKFGYFPLLFPRRQLSTREKKSKRSKTINTVV